MINKIEKLLLIKVNALNEVGKFLGMSGPFKVQPIIDYDLELYARASFMRYMDEDISVVQKYACAMILDYIVPEWRDFLPNGHITHIVDRGAPEVREWRKKVLSRDGNKCVECGGTEDLQAHHAIPWSYDSDLRVNVSNGETLCIYCHAKKHENISNLILSHGKIRLDS